MSGAPPMRLESAARGLAEQTKQAGGQVQAPRVKEFRDNLASAFAKVAEVVEAAPQAQQTYEKVMEGAQYLPRDYREKVARGAAQALKARADEAAQRAAGAGRILHDEMVATALPRIPKDSSDAAIDREERLLTRLLDSLDAEDGEAMLRRIHKVLADRGADSIAAGLLVGEFGRVYLESRGLEDMHQSVVEEGLRAAASVSGPQGDAARVLRDLASGGLVGNAGFMPHYVSAMYENHVQRDVLTGEAVDPREAGAPGEPHVFPLQPGEQFFRTADGRIVDSHGRDTQNRTT